MRGTKDGRGEKGKRGENRKERKERRGGYYGKEGGVLIMEGKLEERLKDKIRGCWSWNMLWFVLFGVGIGLFLVYSPKNVDDYWFMNHLQGWFAGQGVLYPENGGNVFKYGIPFQQIFEIWKEHWLNDNIRLGNLIAPFMLLGPKWLCSGLMLIVLLVWVYMLGKFVGLDLKRSALVGVGLSLIVFVLPWREQFGCFVFQINYIGGTFWGVLIIKELFRNDASCNALSLMQLFVLGFVTFWWQEAIGIPVGVGIGMLMLCRRRFRNLRTLAILIGLIIGTVTILIAPGMQRRMHASLNLNHLLPTMSDILYIWLPGFGVIAFGVIAGIKNGFRKVWTHPKVAFGVSSALASVAVMKLTGNYFRISWWYDVMVCVYAVYFLRIAFPRFWCRYKVRNCIVVCPLLFLSYLHLGSVGYVLAEVRKEMESNFYYGIRYPGRNRFVKYAYISDLPLLSGYLPFRYPYEEYYDIPLIWWYYGLPYHTYFNYAEKGFGRGSIPEALRSITSESGNLIPGNRGVRVKDGYMFVEATAADIRAIEEQHLLYTVNHEKIYFGNNSKMLEIQGVLFQSEEDGRDYLYLRPCFNWYVSHFKRVSRIDKE